MRNILVLYHHKTGCVLSKTIFELYKKELKDKIDLAFNKVKDISVIEKNKLKKKFIFKFKLKNEYNFYYQASPCYIFDIIKNLKFKKIIHFIREPYEQSISNYNYHVQYPTPEKWFLDIDNNTDRWFSNTKLLKLLFNILELDYDIIKLCKKRLKKIFKPKKSKTYLENLLNLSKENKENAIIVETFRFIFDTKHILKMASIIKLNEQNKDKFLYLKINDFKNDDINETIDKINKFIFEEEIIDLNKIIKLYQKKYESVKNRLHISSTSKEEKENLKIFLSNNVYINLIFKKVHDIMFDYI